MDLFELSAKLTLDSSEYESGLDSAENSAKSKGNLIGNALGTVGKIGAAALGTATVAIGALAKSAVDAYADYEQLVGGVETLFGTGGKSLEEYAKSVGKSVTDAQADYNKLQRAEKKALTNADKAWKTAGLSANEYMELSTSFAASLINSLDGDTEAAVDKADMAITDMADNVNKMGSSVESVQNAYNGFAKGNFTMLDNLKLGYGGTKEEMERLLAKASEISGIEYDISSYSDIVDAIHVVQTEMGITGTTAKEASSTISGSAASMKASWENLVISFGRGSEETKTAMGELVESFSTWLSNVIPVVGEVLANIAVAIKDIVPVIIEMLPGIAKDILPTLLSSAAELVVSMIEALPGLLSGLWDAVQTAVLAVDWVDLGTRILNATVEAFADLQTWATDTWEEVKTAIQTVNWIEVGNTIYSGIVSIVATVPGYLWDLFMGAVDLIKLIDWGALGQWILDKISETIGGIVTSLTDFFTEAKRVVKEDIDWSQLGTDIWNAISGAFHAVQEFFVTTFLGGHDGAKNGVNWVALGESIWEFIGAAFAGLFDAFKAFFTEAYNGALSIDWEGLGTSILETVWMALAGLTTKITDVFRAAKDFVLSIDWLQLGKDIIDFIFDAFEGIGAAFINFFFEGRNSAEKGINWKDLGEAIWDYIKAAFSAVADFYKGIFTEAYNRIKNIKWAELGNIIWGWISDAFSDLTTWANNKFSGVRNAIKNIDWKDLGNAMWDLIQQGINGVKGLIKRFAELFLGVDTELTEGEWAEIWKNAGDTILGLITDPFVNLADDMKTFFSDAITAIMENDWFQMGADILQDIIDGLGDVAGAVSSLFDWSSIYVKTPHFSWEWRDGPMGLFQYPWVTVSWYRKAYDLPRMFTGPTVVPTAGGLKGFGDGAGNEIVLSEEKLKQITGGNQGMTQNNTINVYAQPGQDAEEIARAVQDQLVRWEDQRKAACA